MPYRLACDIHTHTLYSRHAYSTITENVAAARAAGIEVLGSADHFSSMLYPEPDVRNFQFFLNQDVWPRVWDGVVVLRGLEADILSLDGGLFGQDVACPKSISGRPYKLDKSLYERVTGQLDYVVASVHNPAFTEGASIAQTTQMYLNALEEPKVFVLGHTGRSGVPYDLDEVLLRAKELHKLIEVNEHSLRPAAHGKHDKVCRRIAERAAELGCKITVSTDAHLACSIGRFPQAASMLEEIHFPQELIASRSRASMLSELAAAGVCDLTELAEPEEGGV